MSVEAERYIKFTCEKCDKTQYASDSLEQSLWKGCFVMSDRIDCDKCNHVNHVYMHNDL